MFKKFSIFLILAIILGFGAFFVFEKKETVVKEISTVSVNPGKKVCTGFAKWTKDGEFKTIRSTCITEKEYKDLLNAPEYLCNYYQKSIWKESEREYGKNNIDIPKKN